MTEDRPVELIKGTLDVLILKTLSTAPLHGYGISRSIREATRSHFQVEEGALYPALRRLQQRGYLESEWGVTDTGREAKFYRLTRAGRRELKVGIEAWHGYVAAMALVLGSPS